MHKNIILSLYIIIYIYHNIYINICYDIYRKASAVKTTAWGRRKHLQVRRPDLSEYGGTPAQAVRQLKVGAWQHTQISACPIVQKVECKKMQRICKKLLDV